MKRSLRRSPRRTPMYLCSALDTSAATTILSALASRRGSQVVRSRSAKPLFAGSIPAPASPSRSVWLDNEAFLPRAGSIDSPASRRAHPSGFVYVARFPSAPFPPGTLILQDGWLTLDYEVAICLSENKSSDFHLRLLLRANVAKHAFTKSEGAKIISASI